MKLIRSNIFETNSSSTHSLVILSKEDYDAWKHNQKVLDLYKGIAKDLSEDDKKIIRNEDGSIDYNGEHFDSEYDFMDSDYYDVIDDENASIEYVNNFAEMIEKELDDKVILSIYRGERW